MSFPQNHIDKKWVLELVSGDEHAFRSFFERYYKRIYGFSMKFLKLEDLSEDLTQEIFIKIWKERKKLVEVDDFDAYLFQIARRKCIDYLRKVARDQKLIDQVKVKMEPWSNPFLEYDNMGYLEKMKENLSPQQKVVFDLSRNKGMSYEDIAHELSISKNTVRNHMVEALKVFRKLMEHSVYLLLMEILIHYISTV